MKKTFLGLNENPFDHETVKSVLIPVPFEASVSYGKGTQFGPETILEASSQIELFDAHLNRSCPEFFFHTCASLKTMSDFKTMSEQLLPIVMNALELKKFPIVIGGEHSVAIPAINAFANFYPHGHVVHLDAHADLRDNYENNPWSHACVMRRVREYNLNTLSIGVRSFSNEENEYIQKNKISCLNPENPLFKETLQNQLNDLDGPAWLSFDVDVLDPSIMPSTGTPEPAGLTYTDIMEIFQMFQRSSLVFKGADITEFSPIPRLHHADFTCAKIIHRIALMLI